MLKTLYIYIYQYNMPSLIRDQYTFLTTFHYEQKLF